ncbi:MFS transporter [Saccharopolyspora mangrovi]|uniref:MFS transporter n=1 Tax=Saccharopolyspora mangrovi TaxID=3082379 RepID=A0ABU6AJN9_9PSEU|nr:MFS transporter [Saccharopolyspora sp. S2-29]MEB3371735.1 MFS transporter [Saccharopolyspora sp. S2-29]
MLSERSEERTPVLRVFRTHPIQVVRTALVLFQGFGVTLVFGFGLSYATQPQFGIELPYSTMLWVAIVSNASALITRPLFGMLADRVGRRPVMVTGLLGSAIVGFGYFTAIADRNVPLVFVLGILLAGGALAATTGVFMAFIGEQFDTSVRMSGSSIGFMLGISVGGFAPTIAAALVTETAWIPAPLLQAAGMLVTASAVFFAPETCRVPLRDLGKASR